MPRDWVFEEHLLELTVEQGQQRIDVEVTVELAGDAIPDPDRVLIDSLGVRLDGEPQLATWFEVDGERVDEDAGGLRSGAGTLGGLLDGCVIGEPCSHHVQASIRRARRGPGQRFVYVWYYVSTDVPLARAPADDALTLDVVIPEPPPRQ